MFLLLFCTQLKSQFQPITRRIKNYFSLVIRRTIVHINQLIIFVVIAWAELISTTRLWIAIFLLHSLVFRATVLEPNLNLNHEKERKKKNNWWLTFFLQIKSLSKLRNFNIHALMLHALLSEFLITKINKLTQTEAPKTEHHSITLNPKRNKSLNRIFLAWFSTVFLFFPIYLASKRRTKVSESRRSIKNLMSSWNV